MFTYLPENSSSCPRCPESRSYVRHGGYRRRSDRKWIKRWRCTQCSRTFSEATHDPEIHQKKRYLNLTIQFLLVSCISQRRLSLGLRIHRTTVARKLKFLAIQARLNQIYYLTQFLENPFPSIQLDEMETHEHTKFKPLSVALAVSEKSRKILGFEVSEMPAKGLLAKRARKKYGPRRDERALGMGRLTTNVAPFLSPSVIVTSDKNPNYPIWLKPTGWNHKTIKGRRGSVGGYGELKKAVWDPLFSLNHTCAMIRANVNRMLRKTWCTTKKQEALVDHLWLYMDFHNTVLT